MVWKCVTSTCPGTHAASSTRRLGAAAAGVPAPNAGAGAGHMPARMGWEAGASQSARLATLAPSLPDACWASSHLWQGARRQHVACAIASKESARQPGSRSCCIVCARPCEPLQVKPGLHITPISPKNTRYPSEKTCPLATPHLHSVATWVEGSPCGLVKASVRQPAGSSQAGRRGSVTAVGGGVMGGGGAGLAGGAEETAALGAGGWLRDAAEAAVPACCLAAGAEVPLAVTAAG